MQLIITDFSRHWQRPSKAKNIWPKSPDNGLFPQRVLQETTTTSLQTTAAKPIDGTWPGERQLIRQHAKVHRTLNPKATAAKPSRRSHCTNEIKLINPGFSQEKACMSCHREHEEDHQTKATLSQPLFHEKFFHRDWFSLKSKSSLSSPRHQRKSSQTSKQTSRYRERGLTKRDRPLDQGELTHWQEKSLLQYHKTIQKPKDQLGGINLVLLKNILPTQRREPQTALSKREAIDLK